MKDEIATASAVSEPEEPDSKRLKVSAVDKGLLESLPSAKSYEMSYMHRDIVQHIVTSHTNFVLTASVDGHIKFWKKSEEGIEFVKHFRAHLSSIVGLTMSYDGLYAASVSTDKALKVFDVKNFDMVTMMSLGYVPGAVCFIWSGDKKQHLLAASKGSEILVYDYLSGEQVGTITPHMSKVKLIQYCHTHHTGVSVDESGIIEYWSTNSLKFEEKSPTGKSFFKYKTDTDLFTFLQHKCSILSLTLSPDGRYFATFSSDRKIRVFNFLSAKLFRVYDESLAVATQLQQEEQLVQSIDFGRKLAIERELEKSEHFQSSGVIFDDSSSIIIYPTVVGIKFINLQLNKCVRMIGVQENVR